MDLDNNNDETVVNEDRLSTLPDELLHKILSCVDTKYAVQTSLLSLRWKLLWTSMPYLSFLSGSFSSVPKFAKFVKHVLTRRNHQIEVYSVKLLFTGAPSQFFVKKIANYALAHNVQELTVSCFPKNNREFPPCLFNSPSLKHFSFRSDMFSVPCHTPKTPWDFPALTTLHLNDIKLCDDNTKQSLDLFSKCVNLKNLTLEQFNVGGVEVFDIISLRLSNLILIRGKRLKGVNLITPQLENLTIIRCPVGYLNLDVPPGLSSFSYSGYCPLVIPKYHFKSLNKVNVFLSIHLNQVPYKEEVACKVIDMLQKLHSARYLTLNIDVVECLSAFPDLVSQHPSPFSNLICLNIDSSDMNDTYDFRLSTEARNFLLENSPNSTFIMDLPPSKAMRQKEARARRKAKLVEDVDTHIKEFHALLEHRKSMVVENEQVKEKTKAALAKLMQQVMACAEKKRHNAEMQMAETDSGGPLALTMASVEEFGGLVEQQLENVAAILSKKEMIDSLLKKLPKGQRAAKEEGYSRELQDSLQHCGPLVFDYAPVNKFFEDVTKAIFDMNSKRQDVGAHGKH